MELFNLRLERLKVRQRKYKRLYRLRKREIEARAQEGGSVGEGACADWTFDLAQYAAEFHPNSVHLFTVTTALS